MTILRAYSLFEAKEFDDEQRVITGWATTPTPDRAKDIVEPLGVQVASDIPLFLYHDSWQTVGRTQFGKPTSKGIPYTARLPKVIEAGRLKDRIDEAWQMLKYRLITGVSIGFRALDDGWEMMKDGGIRYLKTEVLELSLVPIPMNAEANVATIKSADQAIRRAASGARPVVRLDPAPAATGNSADPGASGQQQRRKGVVYLK
jgi:HK97 family phage prohead protease